MAKVIKIYILFSIVFLCGSCDQKDHKQEVSARISPILDTISLDYTQYVNYHFVNYTRENVLFRITHLSPDTSLRYSVPVYCNAITGRVEEVPEPRWHVPESGEYIPTPREVAMHCAAINDAGKIEKMLKPVIRFREAIGSNHIYSFQGAVVIGNKVSEYDFKISFNNKGRYYLLTHYIGDIPAEEMRVTERWSIKEIEPPSYR